MLIPDWFTLASKEGLSGVELPLSPAQCQPAALELLRDSARDLSLSLILDAGVVDVDELRRLIRAAPVVSGMERPVIRATVSTVLCGDRRAMDMPWPEYRRDILRRLKKIAPEARDAGVAIALENHQDTTCRDLITLCEEAGPDVVGICMDTGNPLAVGEDPVEFAAAAAPYVRHAHLKDYRMYFAPDGYRLARCAAGDGAVDFPGVLSALAAGPYSLLPGIEVGAQPARHVQILEAGWWAGYGDRPVTDSLPALRVLWRKGLPADREWRNPWEKGAPSAAVVRDELRTFTRSVSYIRGLFSQPAVGSARAEPRD